MKIVVSACLMGESCKYNGLDNYHRELVEACERTGTEVLLVCPEVFGGLPTPRRPSEIVNGEVRTCEGASVDREFRLGAQRALDMCEQAGGPSEIAACVLQDRSPSCGAGRIYDGTFSGTLTAGTASSLICCCVTAIALYQLASSTPACWSNKKPPQGHCSLVVVLG